MLKKDVNITGNTSVMHTRIWLELPRDISKHQQQAVIGKERTVWRKRSPSKAFLKKDRLTRGRTQNEATRRREIRKVLDQFSGIRWILERNTGKQAARENGKAVIVKERQSTESMVQYQQSGNATKAGKVRSFFVLRNALDRSQSSQTT